MIRIGLFVLGLVLATPALADDGAAMQAAANGFYGVYKSLHPSDGVPDASLRARFAPYVSATLDGLMKAAGDSRDRFAAAHSDSPPLAEGDLFTSLFEGASALSVGACTGDGRTGQCTVSCTYTEPAAKPVTWSDTVLLVNTPAGWRVDDIAYGGTWAFGNKGRLSSTLRQVASFQ